MLEGVLLLLLGRLALEGRRLRVLTVELLRGPSVLSAYSVGSVTVALHAVNYKMRYLHLQNVVFTGVAWMSMWYLMWYLQEWHGCRELGSGLLLRYSAFIQVIPSRLSPPSPSVSH